MIETLKDLLSKWRKGFWVSLFIIMSSFIGGVFGLIVFGSTFALIDIFIYPFELSQEEANILYFSCIGLGIPIGLGHHRFAAAIEKVFK